MAPTFLAALRHDRIDAPAVIDGPINGQSFLAYVEQFLIPTLKPGDIVILSCCRFDGHRDKVFSSTGEHQCNEGSSAASLSSRR